MLGSGLWNMTVKMLTIVESGWCIKMSICLIIFFIGILENVLFKKKFFRRSFSVEETQDKSLCIDIQLTFVGKPSNEMSRFYTYID